MPESVISEIDSAKAILPISPAMAIAESWKAVEKALLKLAELHDIPERERLGAGIRLVRALDATGNVDKDALGLVMQLRSLRNKAVHGQYGATDKIPESVAAQFIDTVETILDLLSE